MGGGGIGSQLLMLSPEMLKSQIPISGVGGWPTFDAESGNAKIPNFHFFLGGWWPTFDAESRNAQIPNSHLGGRAGWRGAGKNQFPKVNFKFSKSSPELKFQWGGGGGSGWQKPISKNQLQISKSSPELKFPFLRWGGGGVSRNQFPKVNFKFCKSISELKFPFLGGGGWQKPISKSQLQIQKSSPELKCEMSIFGRGVGGWVGHGMYGIWCCHLACIWG